MTSTVWSWLGALLIAAFASFVFIKKIPGQAKHRNLARLGATLLASGMGLSSPTYHIYIHHRLEITALVLGVIGLALYWTGVSSKPLPVADDRAAR
jgi:hypothetical protein